MKKATFYLSLIVLLAPLVTHAELTVEPNASSLPASLDEVSLCARLPSSLDHSSQVRLQQFYQQRQFQPLWANVQALQALQEQIQGLADDGLSPRDYPLPLLDSPSNNPSCDELLTSHSYLQALRHLQQGRVFDRASEKIWRAAELPVRNADAEVLAVAATHANDIAAAFNAARPQNPHYQWLRKAYAAMREQPLSQWQAIASGPLLKPNSQDSRLPALRTRLQAQGYLSTDINAHGNDYDATTQQALQDFQADHGLNPDGVLGPATLSALNISPLQRRDQLRANLERMRWLGDDLQQVEVLINIASAELQVWQEQQLKWQTRVQVGRADRATPTLISSINRLTLNPTWTVPPTILRKDKLPAIRRDVSYLQSHQMSVYDRNGNPLDPYQVDWDNPGPIILRQAAGTANPLGIMAIRFDNPFSVYLHDTPSKGLFSRAPRAFSSGCVRVQSVESLLPWLLNPDELPRVQKQIASGKTQQYRLQQPKLLVMSYWTAEADENGRVQYFPDIYQHDARLLRQLAN